MNKKIFAVLMCIISILLFLSSCSKPDISEYHKANWNIVWNEGHKIDTQYPGRVYYEIEGVPTDEYIACKWRDRGVGAACYPNFLQHNDFEGEWEFDVSSAKLILSESGFNLSEDEWSSFGQSIVVQEVHQIDSTIAEHLANSILSDSPEYTYGILFNGSHYLLDSERHFLRLQFTLKEYNNLKWIAYIIKYDNSYYIEVRTSDYSTDLLLCSDEFASIIDQVCEEYGIKSRSS